MFNQLFKYTYCITKHTNAPLLAERLKYLQSWQELGIAHDTLTSIAGHLIRIVDYLQLDTRDVITLEEVEVAADRWARYQCKYTQKRVVFSEGSKIRFIRYATHWLTQMNRLKRPLETVIPLFLKYLSGLRQYNVIRLHHCLKSV